jgi:hypothetical protein
MAISTRVCVCVCVCVCTAAVVVVRRECLCAGTDWAIAVLTSRYDGYQHSCVSVCVCALLLLLLLCAASVCVPGLTGLLQS